MKRVELLLLIYCFIFLSLHLWGTIEPSHYNWGTQSFAFYGITAGMAALIVTAGAMLMIFRKNIFAAVERAVNALAPLPMWVLFIAAAAFLTFVTTQFPTEGLMWGDSKIILLTTSKIPTDTEMSANFRNQPLVLLTLRTIQNLLEQNGTGGLKEVYKWVDLCAGVIFLGFVFLYISRLNAGRIEKILIGFFLAAGGGMQFFFGYIENYALLYAFTAGFIVTGWLALKKEIPVFIPLIILLVMVGLHLGALILLPTIVVFLFFIWREKKSKALLTGLAIICIGAGLLWLDDYSISRLVLRIRDAFLYDVLPLFTPVNGIAYTIFSPLHILDCINLNFLVAPFGLLPTVILLVFAGSKEKLKKPESIFLLIASFCGFLFTFIMNPALGMFRDWDLMASFLVPSMFLSAWLLFDHISGMNRKTIFLFITVLAVVHTTARIGINANEDRHLRRAEVLTNPAFMARFAQILYYDRLANVFWERKDYKRVKRWYERYTQLDSSNPRIIANLSDAYRKLNDKENTFRMLKRSAVLGTKDPKVLSNLSVEYYRHNDVANAIAIAESIVAIAPDYEMTHANLGLMYTAIQQPVKGIKHLETAIRLGMNQPTLYKNLGVNYSALGEYKKALNCYRIYLKAIPSDAEVQKIVTKLRTLVQER